VADGLSSVGSEHGIGGRSIDGSLAFEDELKEGERKFEISERR